MKLMQNEFPMFRKIEVELTQEKDIEKIPDRPSKFLIVEMFLFYLWEYKSSPQAAHRNGH